ncbi:MAG: hypothetical protein KAJ03_10160 [Gammaproteobacteria bacterium]|nr:hypothetical protein [Gammaproteobacteria bacterium]
MADRVKSGIYKIFTAGGSMTIDATPIIKHFVISRCACMTGHTILLHSSRFYQAADDILMEIE